MEHSLDSSHVLEAHPILNRFLFVFSAFSLCHSRMLISKAVQLIPQSTKEKKNGYIHIMHDCNSALRLKNDSVVIVL